MPYDPGPQRSAPRNAIASVVYTALHRRHRNHLERGLHAKVLRRKVGHETKNFKGNSNVLSFFLPFPGIWIRNWSQPLNFGPCQPWLSLNWLTPPPGGNNIYNSEATQTTSTSCCTVKPSVGGGGFLQLHRASNDRRMCARTLISDNDLPQSRPACGDGLCVTFWSSSSGHTTLRPTAV